MAELISSEEGERLLAGHRAYNRFGELVLNGERQPDRLQLVVLDREWITEEDHDPVTCEVLRRKHGIDLGLGIGIEAGYATLGRIGFEGRFDYGALGPVTNLASRLSTSATAGQTLIGQHVFAATEEAVETTRVGILNLKGFGRPVTAYDVRQLL